MYPGLQSLKLNILFSLLWWNEEKNRGSCSVEAEDIQTRLLKRNKSYILVYRLSNASRAQQSWHPLLPTRPGLPGNHGSTALLMTITMKEENIPNRIEQLSSAWILPLRLSRCFLESCIGLVDDSWQMTTVWRRAWSLPSGHPFSEKSGQQSPFCNPSAITKKFTWRTHCKVENYSCCWNS